MPLTKKAVAVLSLSAIAFFIAIILLSHDVIRLAPGPEADYLGQTEIKMYNTYLLGEEQRVYIDTAAKYAYENAGGRAKAEEDNEAFIESFTKELGGYLASFNRVYRKSERAISAADFEIAIDEKGVKGIAGKAINITAGYYQYSFRPSFRVVFAEEAPEVVLPAEVEETCTAANGACRTECDARMGESIIPEAVCPKTSGGIAQYCCRPKAETVPLLPPCTDVGGICRLGPDIGEMYYPEAGCERQNEFCFVRQNECESNGNECKAVSCEDPSLAAEYMPIHAYDESCGTGKFCCKKRA